MTEGERDLLETKLNDRCDWIKDALHSVGIDPLFVLSHQDGVTGKWLDHNRVIPEDN